MIFELAPLIPGAPKPVPPDKSAGNVASPTQEGSQDFQIGERVWVNGNKSGHVQFMGGTQFAPGQWAGIVLDEPIGKNDGSVAGVRYFQCEDGRGIFTRPSKLSKTPLPETETNGRQSSPAPDVGATSQPAPAVTASAGEREQTARKLTVLYPDSEKCAHLCSVHGSGIKTSAGLRRMSSESVSNLSDTDANKKIKRELRIRDRVLVRSFHWFRNCWVFNLTGPPDSGSDLCFLSP